MAVVEVIGLEKNYGNIQALRGVTLAVEEKQIFGLLGPNGAGKTTMVKILLNMVRATGGEARLFGLPARRAGNRRQIGYLPEGHDFPDYHTGGSVLEFYGQLYGMSRADRRRRIDEALDVVGMKDWKRTKIRKYSKGMKQRLGIAHAIFHDPKVMFLDEPTDGVDPKGRRDVRDLMFRLRDQGKTIFLNSHLLGEVERVCDRVAIIDRGRLLRTGTVDELTQAPNVFLIKIGPGAPSFIEELRGKFPSATLEGETVEVGLENEAQIDAVIDWLRSRNVSIRGLEEKRISLEELFIEIVEKGSEVKKA